MRQIRPVRGIKRYRESLDFYLYSVRRKLQKEREQDTASAKKTPSFFPFAKQADLQAAEEAAKTVSSVLTAAYGLKMAIYGLSPQLPSSAVNKRAAQSSVPEEVSATAEPAAPLGRLTVEVRRLAAAQMNATARFVPDAPTSMTPGFCAVRLVQGNSSYSFESFIIPEDTHFTALNKLCRALNQSSSSVQATLETDPASRRVRLVLTGTQTGKDYAFSLEDEHGNAAASSGLSVPDIPASDAEYRINGEEWRYSSGNRVFLPDQRLNLAFQGITRQPVILQIIPDARALVRAIRGLAAACSFIIKEVNRAGDYLNPTIARSLQNILSGYQPESLGIHTGGDNMLQVDEEALASRIQASYSEILASLNGPAGLVPKLERQVSRMESAPSESLLNRSNKSYLRYANYMASLERYSQLPAQGLLLNRFL